MTDKWRIYLTSTFGKLAVVRLDMGLAALAPEADKTVLLGLKIKLIDPDDRGFPRSGEFETLRQIEEKLNDLLRTEGNTTYLGCLTVNGTSHYFYYGSAAKDFTEAVQQVMQSFNAYQWQCAEDPDPQWTFYREALYPTPYELESMNNRDQLMQLARQGDNLNQPRMILHWASFLTEAARSEFVERIGEQGFEVDSVYGFGEHQLPHPFGICFGRIESLALEGVTNTTIGLKTLAAECKGTYDGWETSIVKQ
ncbi:DUF695 domain-containing protein [bacterium]|nr:DUF695 domain-containing protein [bacterium]